MTANRPLVEVAEAEIDAAVAGCEASAYSKASRDALWSVFHRWLADPRLLSGTASQLRVTVLNELTIRVGDEHLRNEAWEILRELARRYSDDDPEGMGISLKIAAFEVFAEPPEVPYTLELLFTLAEEPETRWAVFAAYENLPWRLRPHAVKYSQGRITDADCDAWLRSRGLGDDEYLMPRKRD
ncbi:MAG: hypothetical protein H7A46_21450 [Verrucomicrobiales bacterium]|nr:hypothetical protein [Planctomycetota bacterium]MCP5524112.1 hypothetical protein [Verrucomicrobiales bacterium]